MHEQSDGLVLEGFVGFYAAGDVVVEDGEGQPSAGIGFDVAAQGSYFYIDG